MGAPQNSVLTAQTISARQGLLGAGIRIPAGMADMNRMLALAAH